MKVLSVFISISSISLCFCGYQSYTVALDQVFLYNSTALDGFYNVTQMRIAKYNRTTFVLNFDGEIYFDVDETVFLQVEFYVSQFNNNQYQKSPFRVPKLTFCDFMKRLYVPWWQKDLKHTSNLPQFEPNEKPCPLKKVYFFSPKLLFMSIYVE